MSVIIVLMVVSFVVIIILGSVYGFSDQEAFENEIKKKMKEGHHDNRI